MWLLLIVFSLVLFLYILFVKYSYWKNKGVPGPTPIPLIGNVGPSILGQKTIYEVYEDMYNQYQEYSIVGFFRIVKPCLLLRDPEIIKNVLIRDFNHFMDQDVRVDKKVDPIMGNNPFFLKGEEWKKVRQFLTPNFTGGKLKAMFPIAEHATKNLITYLEKYETFEAKDVILRYGCDVGAICAFGIEGNSFEDSDARLLTLIKKFSIPSTLELIKLVILFFLPTFINVRVISKSYEDGLVALIEETIKYRQEHNIKRNDYFEVLKEAPISVTEMAAHITTFIIEASETVSWVVPLILYELAINPDHQEKVREEFRNVLKKSNGELSHEALQSLDYLDACINESLRLHPPFAHISRLCVEDYTITSSSSEFKNINVTLKKGTSILIPILGLQRDPKYFPLPHQYRPERFLDKVNSQKHVFMPFGNGPRMCLGSRFALMQIKVAIIQMLKNFEITLDPKTIQPLKFEVFNIALYPKGGVWLRCKKIEQT